ncbi:hypothetical protein JCM30471_08030 [Desulfuromonas carbonis]
MTRNWQVYILLCSDGSFYTGITTDMERRLLEHGAGRGARYCRGRTPLKLVFLETGHDRSSASRREAQIKGLHAEAKRQLIAGEKPVPNLAQPTVKESPA